MHRKGSCSLLLTVPSITLTAMGVFTFTITTDQAILSHPPSSSHTRTLLSNIHTHTCALLFSSGTCPAPTCCRRHDGVALLRAHELVHGEHGRVNVEHPGGVGVGVGLSWDMMTCICITTQRRDGDVVFWVGWKTHRRDAGAHERPATSPSTAPPQWNLVLGLAPCQSCSLRHLPVPTRNYALSCPPSLPPSSSSALPSPPALT